MIFSCNTDEFKDFEDATIVQEAAFAFPVGTVDFTLADMLDNDTTLTVGNNNDIKVLYREENFFHLAAADIMDDLTAEIEDSFSQTSKMGEIEIDDVSQGSPLAFANVLDDFNDQSLVTFIEASAGTMVPIPAFEEVIITEEQVPAFTEYSTLTIGTGYMSLTVTNGFFFDLEDLSLEIRDINNSQVLGTFHFDYLAVGETKSSDISLVGKTIGNEFEVEMSTLKSPGTGSQAVLVDLNSELDILFEVKDITISEGVVNLPPGILAEDQLNFDFEATNGEEIKRIELNDALVDYTITSDIQADILVKLEFPYITRNNVPVVQELMVSPTGTSGPITGNFDFSNTSWLLDQDPDQPFNRILASYEVTLPNGSSGQLAFSGEDEISLSFSLASLDIEEVVGYFGFREEVFEEENFDFGFDFSFITDESSPIIFSDPLMRIEIENSFGIPLQGEFNATATGYFGAQATLNPPKIVINSPSLTEMGQSASTVFVMNKNNSNLVDLLSVFPSFITYSGSATINPTGNPAVMNFVRSDSELDADVEFELPFKFRTSHLVYRDTSDAVDLGLTDGGFTIEDIDSAELKIVYDNGLPLQSTSDLIVIDDLGNETTVVEGVTFEAASVDGNGRVPTNGSAQGEVFIILTTEQLLQLDAATDYIFQITMETTNDGQSPVAMYTDYRVTMGIGLRVVIDRE